MSRDEKLADLQRQHSALVQEIKDQEALRKPIDNRIRKLQSRRHRLGQAIYDLKHEGETPTITDHAIVRYLERVRGVDINELKVEVAHHKQAVRQGNVIVTVNEDRTDA